MSFKYKWFIVCYFLWKKMLIKIYGFKVKEYINGMKIFENFLIY